MSSPFPSGPQHSRVSVHWPTPLAVNDAVLTPPPLARSPQGSMTATLGCAGPQASFSLYILQYVKKVKELSADDETRGSSGLNNRRALGARGNGCGARSWVSLSRCPDLCMIKDVIMHKLSDILSA